MRLVKIGEWWVNPECVACVHWSEGYPSKQAYVELTVSRAGENVGFSVSGVTPDEIAKAINDTLDAHDRKRTHG